MTPMLAGWARVNSIRETSTSVLVRIQQDLPNLASMSGSSLLDKLSELLRQTVMMYVLSVYARCFPHPSAYFHQLGMQDGDWGTFKSDPIRTKSNLFTATNDDGFPPTIASTSAAGFESSFHPTPSFDDAFGSDDFTVSSSSSTPSSSFMPDEDDFGDFETATSSPSITLPTLESEASLTDFDFNESTKVTPLAFEAESSNRPSFGRTITADDGSKFFGGLSSDGPFEATDLATSQEEPLGPSLHPGTHLTEEGKLEARIDGKIVTVPADEVSLALKVAYIWSVLELMLV